MAYAEMVTKIQTDWETAIGSTYPTMYQNEDEQDFSKPNNGIWIRLTVKPADSFTVAVGSEVEYRMPIVILAQVFAPIGSKIVNSNAVVKLIHDQYAYRDLNIGDTEGTVVKFAEPSVQDIGRDRGIYQTNISVRGEVDYFK